MDGNSIYSLGMNGTLFAACENNGSSMPVRHNGSVLAIFARTAYERIAEHTREQPMSAEEHKYRLWDRVEELEAEVEELREKVKPREVESRSHGIYRFICAGCDTQLTVTIPGCLLDPHPPMPTDGE